jgi:hypothetical protein
MFSSRRSRSGVWTARVGPSKVVPEQRLYVGVVYLSLLVLLVAGIQATLVAT